VLVTSRLASSIGLVLGALLLPLGCGGDEGDGGGAGGAAAATGGTSGAATGGAGTGGAAAAYWPAAYNPAGAPVPADSVYHATVPATACMPCHGTNGPAVLKLAFGGIVYRADGVTPAANVEIGVKDGTNQYFVYSAASGLYWAAGPDNVNWPVADIRMRNASGEVPKLSTSERGADCDSCHVGAQLLTIAP